MFSFSSRYRAFTLVEVILAISLLSLVLTMVAGLVINGIRVNTANVHQLQAQYLAEEGIEMIRNMRDSNWWQNENFSAGADLWHSNLTTGVYAVSVNDANIPWKLTAIALDGSDRANQSHLYNDKINNVSVLSDDPTGTLSMFSRFITIVDTDTNDGTIDVLSTVQWSEHGTDHKIVLSTSLTDWKGGPL